MNYPLVSIIIPTYNRANLIGETLDSILAQTYQNWECIIVDDGSTDDTSEVIGEYLKRDSRFKYFQRPNEHLSGGNGARNYGFKLSQGEYIQWFDSDDILMDDYLTIKMKYLNNDAIVSPMLKFSRTPDKIIPLSKNNIYSKTMIKDYLGGLINFYVSGALWKKDFLLKSNASFDEKISNMDDWDFNLRMLYEKPKLFFLEKPHSLYRIHRDSLYRKMNRNKDIKEIYSDLRAREKHIKIVKNIYPEYLDDILELTDRRYFRFLKIINAGSKSDSLILIMQHLRFKFKYNKYSNFKNLLFYFMITFVSNRGYNILKDKK